jgi:hypothetical protein
MAEIPPPPRCNHYQHVQMHAPELLDEVMYNEKVGPQANQPCHCALHAFLCLYCSLASHGPPSQSPPPRLACAVPPPPHSRGTAALKLNVYIGVQ